MESISNPHDRFFKKILSQRESAIDFLEHYLPPEIKELVDFTTLLPIKDSFIDDELQTHFSDVLFQVDLQHQDSLYFYVLFEHKSYHDPQAAFQMLRYMVRIWEYITKQGRRLAPIFPILFYHGKTSWKTGRHFHDLFNIPEALKSYVPDYRYWLCDLSQYADEELKGNVLLQVGLLTLKYIFHEKLPEKLPDIFRLLRHLTHKETGLEYIEVLLKYLANTEAKLSDEDLQKAVREAAIKGGNQIMPTLAQRWIEEGRKEGREEGRKEGRKEGLEEGLLNAIEFGLELKFSVQGLKELTRIRKITNIDLLRTIQTALKSVNTLEELQEFYQDFIPDDKRQSQQVH